MPNLGAGHCCNKPWGRVFRHLCVDPLAWLVISEDKRDGSEPSEDRTTKKKEPGRLWGGGGSMVDVGILSSKGALAGQGLVPRSE